MPSAATALALATGHGLGVDVDDMHRLIVLQPVLAADITYDQVLVVERWRPAVGIFVPLAPFTEREFVGV